LLTLYARTGPRERAAVVGEFKTVLSSYLEARLSE
jgi:hypothetical protein